MTSSVASSTVVVGPIQSRNASRTWLHLCHTGNHGTARSWERLGCVPMYVQYHSQV
jgi:hypothetical protein